MPQMDPYPVEFKLRVSCIIVDLIDLLLVSQFTNKSQKSQKFNQLQ